MDMFDRISVLLTENKKSLRTMCFDLGMPYSTLSSKFQRRSKNIDLETTKKIALYLDTTLEYLITGNEEFKYNSLRPANKITIVTEDKGTIVYTFSDEKINAIITILDNMVKE